MLMINLLSVMLMINLLYANDQSVTYLLDPAILFGQQHSYSTRAPPHCANIITYLLQKHF